RQGAVRCAPRPLMVRLLEDIPDEPNGFGSLAESARPPHSTHRAGWHYWRRPFPRFREGHPPRRTWAAPRLCGGGNRRFPDHARPGRVAHLSTRRRLLRGLRGRVLRALRRLRHGVVLLVHVGGDGDGGAHRDRYLRALLASRRAAMASRAGR